MDTVRTYLDCWNLSDSAQRRQALSQCWAADGRYVDPRNVAEGRDALHTLIETFRERNPGAAFKLTTGVDEHHDMLRFGWALLDASGQTQLEGFDIGELDGERKLRRITGFFGPFPLA